VVAFQFYLVPTKKHIIEKQSLLEQDKTEKRPLLDETKRSDVKPGKHTEPSEIISVYGRVGQNSDINGVYHKQSTLHQGRVWYKKESSDHFIRWYPIPKTWFIRYTNLNGITFFMACAHQDIPAPEFLTVPWKVSQNGQLNEDRNVKVIKKEFVSKFDGFWEVLRGENDKISPIIEGREIMYGKDKFQASFSTPNTITYTSYEVKHTGNFYEENMKKYIHWEDEEKTVWSSPNNYSAQNDHQTQSSLCV
jgi:hypothetical protein